MSSIEPCPEPDRLAIEGMEHVFAADGAASGPSDGHPDISGEVDQGQDGRVSDALTIQQAVHYFGLPASVIRQKIDREEIAAIRIRSSAGPEWLVYPDGLPGVLIACREPSAIRAATNSLPANQPLSLSEPIARLAGDTPVESSQQWLANHSCATADLAVQGSFERTLIEELWIRVSDLESKLEAATYRNGYLEAKLENYQDQIRLLTERKENSWFAVDSEVVVSVRKASWWLRFCRWLTGTSASA